MNETILVRILDEGAVSWLPVPACHLDGVRYQILPHTGEQDYDAVLEFSPGQIVDVVPYPSRESFEKMASKLSHDQSR